MFSNFLMVFCQKIKHAKLMRFLKPLAVAFLLPATFASVDASTVYASTLAQEAKTILAQDTLKWQDKLPFDNNVTVGQLKKWI